MSYWEFVAECFAVFTNPEAWYLWYAILAALVAVGGVAAGVFGSSVIADEYGPAWNFLYLPVVVVVTGMLVLLLAWSAYGVS